ncbi:hypothetical protein MLD38_004840 [Melastoma candidum]|uniref:Uncharacterized protein n=1 Tax=Melastoma candidum TaxID=119954 RepID=A0ACB9S6P6_9MYRT|nr:hypothetical protein MLD38_004840 [Melastoma candidum]
MGCCRRWNRRCSAGMSYCSRCWKLLLLLLVAQELLEAAVAAAGRCRSCWKLLLLLLVAAGAAGSCCCCCWSLQELLLLLLVAAGSGTVVAVCRKGRYSLLEWIWMQGVCDWSMLLFCYWSFCDVAVVESVVIVIDSPPRAGKWEDTSDPSLSQLRGDTRCRQSKSMELRMSSTVDAVTVASRIAKARFSVRNYRKGSDNNGLLADLKMEQKALDPYPIRLRHSSQRARPLLLEKTIAPASGSLWWGSVLQLRLARLSLLVIVLRFRGIVPILSWSSDGCVCEERGWAIPSLCVWTSP